MNRLRGQRQLGIQPVGRLHRLTGFAWPRGLHALLLLLLLPAC